MTDTDRELLELAAKAAGLDTPRYVTDGFALGWTLPPYGISTESGPTRHRLWNPLVSNSDAFSLMVQLGLSLRRDVLDVGTFLRVREMNCGELGVAMLKDDPLAATRRAIVRAAAEIGRNMK